MFFLLQIAGSRTGITSDDAIVGEFVRYIWEKSHAYSSYDSFHLPSRYIFFFECLKSIGAIRTSLSYMYWRRVMKMATAILAYSRTKYYFYAYYALRTLISMICEGSVQCIALAYVVILRLYDHQVCIGIFLDQIVLVEYTKNTRFFIHFRLIMFQKAAGLLFLESSQELLPLLSSVETSLLVSYPLLPLSMYATFSTKMI